MTLAKKCTKCLRELDIDQFNWKVINVLRQSHCRECSRGYVRNHYYKNKKYYLNKAKKRNSRLRNQAHEYLGNYLKFHPCVDCGETDILVLEFDHKDRNSKDSEVSSIIKTGTIDKVIEEVSKCDVRCANCHRRKTGRESKSWKLKYAPIA